MSFETLRSAACASTACATRSSRSRCTLLTAGGAGRAQLRCRLLAHAADRPISRRSSTSCTAKASRGPLQSLLMLVEEQLAIVAEDLDQLYDDQFIETCAPG